MHLGAQLVPAEPPSYTPQQQEYSALPSSIAYHTLHHEELKMQHRICFLQCGIPATGDEPYNPEIAGLSKAALRSHADLSKITASDLCIHFDQVSPNTQNFSGFIKYYST